jgi:hypothetical protein
MINLFYGSKSFEKLLVAQILRKFPVIYMDHEFSTEFTKAPPPVHILTHMNPVHILSSIFL